MSWNYRVIKKIVLQDDMTFCTYGVHEVYYDDKDGKPYMCTEEPVRLDGDDIGELSIQYWHMGRAFGKPTLEYDDIGK